MTTEEKKNSGRLGFAGKSGTPKNILVDHHLSYLKKNIGAAAVQLPSWCPNVPGFHSLPSLSRGRANMAVEIPMKWTSLAGKIT